MSTKNEHLGEEWCRAGKSVRYDQNDVEVLVQSTWRRRAGASWPGPHGTCETNEINHKKSRYTGPKGGTDQHDMVDVIAQDT